MCPIDEDRCFANCEDPDETAHHGLSHLDLHFLPFYSCFQLLTFWQQWVSPNAKIEESISETLG